MSDSGELDAAHDLASILDRERSLNTFRWKVEAAGIGYEPEGPEIEECIDISGIGIEDRYRDHEGGE